MGRILLSRTARIYNALLMSQAAFVLVAFVSLAAGRLRQPVVAYAPELVWSVVAGANLAMFLAANGLFGALLRAARRRRSLSGKLRAYFTASVLRVAVLNGTNLFNLTAFHYMADPYLLLPFGLVVAYFVSLRPTLWRARRELPLPPADHQRVFGA
jgi:hypothetical protein